MIDLTIHQESLDRAIERARENGIIIPTFAQMRNPNLVPPQIVERLKKIGLWDVDPANLFRITWHNEHKMQGGTYPSSSFLPLLPA